MEEQEVIHNEPHILSAGRRIVYQQSDVFYSLMCGALAGIAAKTVIAPAERIKMSFQVSSERFSMAKAIARGRYMVQGGGVLSLWKGHSTTILRVAPYAGISYMFHDYAENLFKVTRQSDKLPALYKFLAGSIGGMGGTLLTYPLDVLRVRLALGTTWKASLAQGGLFQGLLPTILGIVPYSGTAWLTKQTLLEAFQSHTHSSPSLSISLLINTAAGIFGQFVTYPLDVVRRRMQVAVRGEGQRAHSFRQVVVHLVDSEGMRGLSKGFSMNIIKGPISLSISLTVFDVLKSYEPWVKQHIIK